MRLSTTLCRALVLGAGAAVLGCTSRDPSPSFGPEAICDEYDVVYGTGGGEDLRLNLYAPRDLPGPLPAIVIIHGGGWCDGSKDEFQTFGQVFAAWGYVAVMIDYRLAPRHRFPAPLEDAKCAVRWLRANAARYRIDPDRIAALGISAGAQLALLLGFTEPADGFEGKGGNPEQSSRVQAVVNCMGPTDLTRTGWPDVTETMFVALLGGSREQVPAAYRAASPITYVRKGAPPVLTLHGTADEIVPDGQATLLDAALRAVGATSRLERLEGKDHGWTWTHDDSARSTRIALDFLEKELRRR
jgi:acetyl esterase/lipase